MNLKEMKEQTLQKSLTDANCDTRLYRSPDGAILIALSDDDAQRLERIGTILREGDFRIIVELDEETTRRIEQVERRMAELALLDAAVLSDEVWLETHGRQPRGRKLRTVKPKQIRT